MSESHDLLEESEGLRRELEAAADRDIEDPSEDLRVWNEEIEERARSDFFRFFSIKFHGSKLRNWNFETET